MQWMWCRPHDAGCGVQRFCTIEDMLLWYDSASRSQRTDVTACAAFVVVAVCLFDVS